MTAPQPLVCVFLKLPPSYRPLSRMREIAWNEFLSQVNFLNRAFEAAQAPHPSSEAKEIWTEARKSAAKKMTKLQDVTFTNYLAASAFVSLLDSLHTRKYIPEAWKDFQDTAGEAVEKASIAQEAVVQFREDLRITVGRIATIISGDDKDMSSFIAETSEIMLKLATSAEECGGVLEEYRGGWKEAQQQGFDDQDNPPSDEEFQLVQGKWQEFYKLADPFRKRWHELREQMCEPEDSQESGDNGEPVTTSPDNPTVLKMSSHSSKVQRVPFWRKFFRRISSYLKLEKIS